MLVTGADGFIGLNLVKKLLAYVLTARIIGIDSMNDYYDIRLKEYRFVELNSNNGFVSVKGYIADKPLVQSLFEKYMPSVVVNLAHRPESGIR